MFQLVWITLHLPSTVERIKRTAPLEKASQQSSKAKESRQLFNSQIIVQSKGVIWMFKWRWTLWNLLPKQSAMAVFCFVKLLPDWTYRFTERSETEKSNRMKSRVGIKLNNRMSFLLLWRLLFPWPHWTLLESCFQLTTGVRSLHYDSITF